MAEKDLPKPPKKTWSVSTSGKGEKFNNTRMAQLDSYLKALASHCRGARPRAVAATSKAGSEAARTRVAVMPSPKKVHAMKTHANQPGCGSGEKSPKPMVLAVIHEK